MSTPRRSPPTAVPRIVTALVIALVIAAVAAAGCGTSTAPAAPATARPASHPAAADPRDAAFLARLRAAQIDLGTTDAQTIVIGHQVCTELDHGTPPETLLAELLAMTTVKNAGSTIGAAVGSYCPSNVTKLPLN